MPYGTIKIDTITFTDGGVDKSVPVSGLVQNPTFTGNITATGTISGNIIQGGTTVSGLTVTGTTANFASGVFTTQVSGVTVIATTGTFTSLTGTTTTMTSGVFALGTEPLPSISFASDPNTGIYSPGADQLAVATNGTQRLLIDSGGITSTNGGVFSGDVTSYGVQGLVLTFNSNNSEIRACRSGGNYSSLLFFTPGANSSGVQAERVRITSEGLVGIGTSSINDRLEVNGVVRSAIVGANTVNTVQGAYRFNNPTYPNQFAAIYGYTTTSSVDQIELAFLTSGTSGTPTERMRLTQTGLGIGTTSPNTALEVNGTIRSGTGSGATLATGSIDVGKDIGLADGQGIVLGTARRIAISSTGTTTLNAAAATAPFIANIGASEAARLDSSGRLLVGTSNARRTFLALLQQVLLCRLKAKVELEIQEG